MSSGTNYDPRAGRDVSAAVGDKVMARIERLGMSPRQQALNRYYAHYRCLNYDARKVDWNGHPIVDPIEHEAVASAGFVAPGYYDAGASLPLKFRKPTAPYYLAKVIVDRFTGLLFSERRHPKLRVEGDPATEDWTRALADEARLWPMMIRARTMGGAMGTAVVGFQFVEGRPVVEVHDPRWVFPTFADRSTLKLSQVEIRYMYPEDERAFDTGRWEQVWYWSRRIISDRFDVVFQRAPVGDGEEPEWKVEREVEHGLGFCPVVWTQNLPVEGDVDGDPDCQGIYDTMETIDMLLAQADRGTIANADPTLVVVTEARFAEIRKGSDNAIRLPPGSDAKYLLLSGEAAKTASDLSDKHRAQALEVAQCVLEHPDVANQTATEVVRRYESMFAKADVLREQYGERLVKPLLDMMVTAARKLGTPRVEGDRIVRSAITLPPRIENGRPVPRKLGDVPGVVVELQWPPYNEPSIDEALKAVQAAVAARAGKVVDAEHAANYVAPYLRVEDVPAMLKKIERESADAAEEFNEMAMRQMPGLPRTG